MSAANTKDVNGLNIKEFDFVVVGAGASAMSLLYGLLSRFREAFPPFSIAVLERGKSPPYASATRSPNQWCDASHHQSSSVALLESKIGNRIIDVPIGKGMGGSTNVNACLCTPPARDDFASWPEPWDKELLSSIHVIQDEMIANGALWLYTVDGNPYESCMSAQSKICEQPLRESIFPSLVTHIPLSISKKDDGTFVRKNYYESLVEPLLKAHPHLADYVTFFCDFEVQRLLFSEDAQKVIGVEGPRKQAVVCRQEVILCAGAIESPALLLVSGIGLDDALGQVGICPRASCAGVGRRLRDHVLVPRVLLSRWSPPTLSPNGVHALCYASNGDSRFQFFMNDAAVYSQLVPHFVASFVRRRIYKPAIMASTVNFILSGLFLGLRTLLRLLMTYTPAYFILRYHIITMNIALMNPKSTGSVTIRRREPSKKIEPIRRKDVDIHIDAGYLSNPDDVLALWDGWKTSTHLFDSFLCQCLEIFPGVIFQGIKLMRNRETTDASWFLRFASHFCLPYFHWCGTCAMKTEDNAEWVVDSSLRVRGVRGIRVCDASVFPSAISGPTALTCAGVGHLCASILLRENDKKNG